MPEYQSGKTYSSGSSYSQPPAPQITKEQHQKILDAFGKRVARSEAKAKTSDLEVAQPELKHQSPVLKPQSLRQYASREPQNQSPSLAELGKQAHNRQDYAVAYELYSRLVTQQPDNQIALFYLSISANQTDNHAVAIETTEKLIDSGQYTAQASYLQGLSYEQLGRLQQAAIAYKQAGAEIPEAKSAFMRLEEERLLGSFASIDKTSVLDVENLNQVDKLVEAVNRAVKYFPGEVGEEIKVLFSPANLAMMMGVFAVYAAASFTGFSQGLTFAMGIAGLVFFGLDVVAILGDLAGFAGAVNANTEQELDEAGEHLASLVAKIGVDALMTLVTGKIAQEIGKSIDNLNQVDEVHAHSDDLTPGRVNDVDNASGQIQAQTTDSNIVVPSNLNGLDAVEFKRLSDLTVDKGLKPSSIVTLYDELGLKNVKEILNQTDDEIAAAIRSVELERVDGGHSIDRHGPQLEDRVLEDRLTKGITPNDTTGNLRNAPPGSTRFSNYRDWEQTRNAAWDEIENIHGADLSKPPANSDPTKYQITVEYNRAIDEGYVGKGSKVKASDLATKKKIKLYSDTDEVSGITRTLTTVAWDNAKQVWKVVQHFPLTKGWDDSLKTYSQPADASVQLGS